MGKNVGPDPIKVWEEVRSETAFLGTTGEINLGTGNGLAVMLENPAGSGIDVHLHRLVAGKSTGTYVVPEVRLDPDTDLPTTSRDVHNRWFGSGVTANANLKADDQSTAPSGGVNTELDIPLDAQREEIRTELVIPPGHKITLWLGGNLLGESGIFIGYWWEQPGGDQ